MRNFVVVGHLAKVTPDFSLEDIPGSSGRIDILCRCINSAFFLSHGMRRDTETYLVLCGGQQGQLPTSKIIRIRGSEVRHLNPDERTTAALLKKALALPLEHAWVQSTPGIYVCHGDLGMLLRTLQSAPQAGLSTSGSLADLAFMNEEGVRKDVSTGSAHANQDRKAQPLVSEIYYLREDGIDIREECIQDGIFVLGDHLGMTDSEEELLSALGSRVISVGPCSLHADHCIILINNELDRSAKEPA
jgi:tRNA (pseudouridine54-N1)-methyltransferase